METDPRVSDVGGLPVGTVTFLLTDIEASSRGWETDPATMSKAVAKHYEILDQAIARHGGARPQEQGEGDSVVAVFPRAKPAVACALDIQRALAKETWDDAAGIRVRIGLHTGDARLRDEGNYFGESIVRCARLRALAHGGQILLSQATELLVVDQLPERASLKDLGEHRLKDLSRPEHVFQVTHPDLRDDFPPLRVADGIGSNLPLQLTSFIGRQEEISAVRALMDESRLVTLTGAGGCGKTRLALRVAAESVDRRPDGTWWVDLAPLSDPDLVSSAVAAALSVREISGQALTETLVGALRGKHALIMLDNCEHLIDACAEIARLLLHGCPRISVLATSREPLGVEGEIAWRVPSLSLPDAAEEPTSENFTRSESVRLFVDRALRARPNFVVTDGNAPVLAEICTRLDGIPLALELAAARVRLLSLEQIVAGLSDRFRLLIGGRRSALPRQRTLEASVDWSYTLLTEAERAMLRRLSVFAGGFTLDAAEDVCAEDPIDKSEVLDLLSSLVDRSLVQVEEVGPSARYRLLETIRAYTRQKLADDGTADLIRDRHLDHFAAFAERVAPELERGDQSAWLDRLETEIDNLRSAMEWAGQRHRDDQALKMVASLTRYWVFRSRLSEAGRRLDEALATNAGDAGLRARAFAWRGYVAAEVSDLSVANARADDALTESREQPDAEVTALAQFAKAHGALFVATGDERTLFEETISAAREANLPSVLARASGALGYLEMRVGRPDQAPKMFDEGWAAARRSGDRFAQMIVSCWAGLGTANQGHVGAARVHLAAALEQARELQTRWIIAACLSHVAQIDAVAGKYASARALTGEARAIASELQHPVQASIADLMSGCNEYATGNLPEALSELDRSIETARSVAFTLALGPALAMRAIASLSAGDRAAASSHAEEGAAIGRRTDYPWALGHSLRCLASLAFDEGDVERAEDLEHEALSEFLRMDRRVGIVDSLEGLARVANALESEQEATRLIAAAEGVRRTIPYVRSPIDGPRHEQLLTALRSRLGDDAFDHAWIEGASLELDAAVAYAARGRGERKRPSSGWASLTPAELDVVRLVVEGLTNPQIAERMFISRATVKTHLGHIFAKLGVATRAELAVDATRRGL